MFKQQAISKLPTFLQFIKDHDLREEDFSSPITKILWGDTWKSITFQTIDFRYSLKFNTEEEYKDACSQVLDAFQPNAPMLGAVSYESETGEVEVTWVRCAVEGEPSAIEGKQWDWGIVCESYDWKKPRSSGKKRPSAKLTTKNSPPPDEAPF